jgi:hypothetical protein
MEPKGKVLTSAADPVLPAWFGSLSVEGIRGRWGKASLAAKGDENAMLTVKQIYARILTGRTQLDEDELAA